MGAAVVVGMGIYQLPLIQFLKDKGFFVIGVSPDGNYPGLETCDKHVPCDILDIDGVCRYFDEEELEYDFAITSGSDLGVTLANKLNQLKGNRHIDPLSLARVTSKSDMKEWFKDASILTPKVFTPEDLASIYARRMISSTGLILKAVRGSGSAEVFVARSDADLQRAMRYFEQVGKEYLIEEFCSGLEFGAQLIVKDGRVVKIMVHDDWMAGISKTVPVAHKYPSVIDEDLVRETCAKIATTGPRYGIYNLDFILKDGHAYLIELGFRPGATGLPELSERFHGVNLYAEALCLCGLGSVNLPSPTESRDEPISYSILWADARTYISELSIERVTDFLNTRQHVLSWHLDIRHGTNVNCLMSGRDRFGHVIASDVHNDWEAVSVAKEVQELIA